MTPATNTRAARLAPAAFVNRHIWHTKDSAVPSRAQRLPAFGRRLRDAVEAGYRPLNAGGGIVVTTSWRYARAFDPGRIVCPPCEPAAEFDFGFLRGCEIIVLVPEVDEVHGEALVTAIRNAGALLVVLAVNRSGES